MSLAEGVQVRVSYKAYSSGVITDITEADTSTDPGAASAQQMRRVSSSLALTKDTYQSNEILPSRQLVDYRHGARRVTGGVNGEYSPATWKDFQEAAARGTWAAAVALSESDLTSATFDATAKTVVFASGDPVALGLRVGNIVRFTNLATAGNNSTNFVLTSFGGTSNRTVGIYPAPTTETADTAFNVTTVGKSLIVPATGHVSRKFAFEHYYNDLDIHELFTECRIGGYNISLPATGMATFDIINVMGRDKVIATGASSPYFTSPTAANTNGIFQAVNGLLQVAGTTVGVVTGLNVSLALNPSTPAVIGQNFPPEIFLGKANVTGQISALLKDEVLLNDFINETEVSILAYLTTSSLAAADATTIYIPRVKFSAGAVAVQGESGQALSLPFQALYYNGAVAGVPATTIQICDTLVT